MNTLYELKKERNQYYDLKDKLYYIVKRLDLSVDCISPASDTYKYVYTIDSVVANNDKLNKLKKELLDKRNYISNVIIPKINERIYNLNLEIEIIQGLG